MFVFPFVRMFVFSNVLMFVRESLTMFALPNYLTTNTIIHQNVSFVKYQGEGVANRGKKIMFL